MRSVPMAILILLLPLAAAAQTAAPPVPAESGTRDDPPRLGLSLETTAAPLLTRDQRAQPAVAAPTDRRPRRPSMVGYINDAGIQTQVRLRFDAGSEIKAPDRAEFFYAKCGCFRDLPSDHPAFDPSAPGPGPGIASELSYQQFYAQAEYAIRNRFSVYGELPVRWLHPQAFVPDTGSFDDQSGISDVRAGLKWGMLASDTQALTLQVQGIFPSGDGRKGLGVEHFSFEPALLYNQAVGDRVRVEGQFGAVLPVDGSDGIGTTEESFAGKVLYYGIGSSVEVGSGDVRFAPVLELVGWHLLSGFGTATLAEVDGMDIVNLKIGGRFVFRNRSSVYVGYGRGLTDAVWYHDVWRIEFRQGF